MGMRKRLALVTLILTIFFNLPLMTYGKFYIMPLFVDGRKTAS
jgi:TRAP-type mannitol/chloroaromatic compound transport system permease small subunit